MTTTKKGPGVRVRPGEIRRYEQLREAGWSPQAAAEAIGRSTSWAYLHEGSKKAKAKAEEREPLPSQNLSEMVELTIAVKRQYLLEQRARNESPYRSRELRALADAEESKAFAIVDRFSAACLPFLADLAYLLANVQASSENQSLALLLEDTPMAQEHAADPVTAEDILRAVPPMIDQHRRTGRVDDWGWEPPKVQAWLRRLEQMYPELKEVADEVAASDDPAAAAAEMRKEMRKAMAANEPTKEALSTTGHRS